MIILDTSAIVAMLMDEDDAAEYYDALRRAEPLGVSAFTTFECAVVMRAKAGPQGILDLELFLREFDVRVFAFGEDEAQRAGEAYTFYGKGYHEAGLNLGDCCSYVTAIMQDASLLFKGDDFVKTDVRNAIEERVDRSEHG